MSITIRPMEPMDVWDCRQIVEHNFDAAAGARFETQALTAFGGFDAPQYFVAYDHENKKVAGFAGMRHSWIMNGVWDFIWINVAKDYRGRGIGRDLTDVRVAKAAMQGATAIHLMTQSPKFFEYHGFEIAKTYEGEHPWVLMTVQIGEMAL